MDKELFWFATIVESLPPRRNKHYKKQFALSDYLIRVTLREDIGDDALVSNITITVCDHVFISFLYTYSNLQLTMPWDVAQDGAITFLLCAKQLGLHRDVAVLIAKRVYNNVPIGEIIGW